MLEGKLLISESEVAILEVLLDKAENTKCSQTLLALSVDEC